MQYNVSARIILLHYIYIYIYIYIFFYKVASSTNKGVAVRYSKKQLSYRALFFIKAAALHLNLELHHKYFCSFMITAANYSFFVEHFSANFGFFCFISFFTSAFLKFNVFEEFCLQIEKSIICRKEAFFRSDLLEDIKRVCEWNGFEEFIITITKTLKSKIIDTFLKEISFYPNVEYLTVHSVDANPCEYIVAVLKGKGLTLFRIGVGGSKRTPYLLFLCDVCANVRISL